MDKVCLLDCEAAKELDRENEKLKAYLRREYKTKISRKKKRD